MPAFPPSDPAARLAAFDLAVEAHRPGRKGVLVHRAYGVSETRFWQGINQLIEDPAILAARPVAVNRLNRIRTERENSREQVLDG